MSGKPLVSIGMPVYNGEPYLRESLDSLLGQDYPNVEIVIADNASTDGTAAMCAAYAARDARVRYSRNPENLGCVYSFNRVFTLSRGEYFMWAACDDRWAPGFVSKCSARLSEHSEAALCHVESRQMSMDGRPFDAPFSGLTATDPDPRVRWNRVLSDQRWHMAFYGMMRASCLRRTGQMGEGFGSDLLLVAEMALQGTLVQVPEQLWWRKSKNHLRSCMY